MRAFLLLFALAPIWVNALTLQWGNNPNWPPGTTVEACVNADCISGITGNQRAFNASPGAVIDARVRAVAADGESSEWATISQVTPALPVGVWARHEREDLMPIVASLITEGGSNTNDTSYTTASVAPTSGRALLLVVNVDFYNAIDSGSWPSFSVSGLGLTWTQHQRQIYFPDGPYFYNALYVFRAVGTVTPGTISFSAGQTVDSITWALIELQDADVSGSNAENLIVQTVAQSFTTGSTTTSITLASFSDSGNAVIGLFGIFTSGTFTAGSGLTELSNVSGEYTSTQVSFRDNPQTTISATHSASVTFRAAIGLEIRAAGGGAISITPNDMQHAQSMDAATLLQAHILTVADLLHSQALDNATITQVFTLTPNDARNTQAMDATTLLQQSVISPGDLLHGNSIDATALIQAHTLAIADLLHEQTLDNVTLVVAGNIAPADMLTAQAMDSPLLLQAHIIAPNDARNTQAVDSPTIVQSNVLIPAELDHAVILDSPVIVQANVISPGELLTAQAMDNVTLAVFGSLAVADLVSVQTIESPALTQAHTIGPAELMHVNSIDATTLFQGFILIPADLLHGQAIEGALLDVVFGLSPAELLTAQGIEQPGLIQAHVIFSADLLQANRFDLAGISSGLLRIPTGRAIVLGKSDRYVFIGPADRFILLTPSTRVVS